MRSLEEAIDHILQTQVEEDDYPKGAHRFFQECDPYGDRAQAVAKIMKAIRDRLLSEEALDGPACRAGISALKRDAVVSYIDEPGMRLAIRAALLAAMDRIETHDR